MVVLAAVTAVLTIVTAVQIYFEYKAAKQEHEDLGETVDSLDLLSESLQNFADSIVNALNDVVTAIQDAAIAIMSYMDAWGFVSLICFGLLGFLMFAVLIYAAKINRRL